jgi:murein DD-endopeptidase MepM/ murein hydrolase activator NlpD
MPRPLPFAPLAALAVVVALAAPAAADPIADAKRERDAAQATAVAAAQTYVDALSEQAHQEAEILRLEAEIPALRARAAELRVQVRQRAIQMYQQGSSMPISRMVDAGSVVEAARAIQLTQSAASHDRDVAAELTATAAKLARDEAELRTRKAAQDALVAQLAAQKAELEEALRSSEEALAVVQKVMASQAEFDGVDAAAAGTVSTRASRCPVFGPVAFVNDWGAPRSGGRTHQGNDMFGPYGAPNVAVVSGQMEVELGGLGGIAVWVHGDDGISYYYAHLSQVEGTPRRVERGDVIGYLGATGNAAGGAPHTHFGIRSNGMMVNPYPTLRVLCGK